MIKHKKPGTWVEPKPPTKARTDNSQGSVIRKLALDVYERQQQRRNRINEEKWWLEA